MARAKRRTSGGRAIARGSTPALTRHVPVAFALTRAPLPHDAAREPSDKQWYRWRLAFKDPHPQIAHVRYVLHESFERPTRNVRTPPFALEEDGYGAFDLGVEITFKGVSTAFKLAHHLDVDEDYTHEETLNVDEETFKAISEPSSARKRDRTVSGAASAAAKKPRVDAAATKEEDEPGALTEEPASLVIETSVATDSAAEKSAGELLESGQIPDTATSVGAPALPDVIAKKEPSPPKQQHQKSPTPTPIPIPAAPRAEKSPAKSPEKKAVKSTTTKAPSAKQDTSTAPTSTQPKDTRGSRVELGARLARMHEDAILDASRIVLESARQAVRRDWGPAQDQPPPGGYEFHFDVLALGPRALARLWELVGQQHHVV